MFFPYRVKNCLQISYRHLIPSTFAVAEPYPKLHGVGASVVQRVETTMIAMPSCPRAPAYSFAAAIITVRAFSNHDCGTGRPQAW